MAVLALVVVLSMGSAWWRYVRGDGPTPELTLTGVQGDVRVGRDGSDDRGANGLRLSPRDRVVTATESHAVLTLGETTLIRVKPESNVEVVAVDTSGVSLELEDGALQATVRPESGAVRVGHRDRSIVATSGAFDVGVREGVMRIDATEGSLSLSGMDAVRLEAGQQATVIDRHAVIGPATEELLLAVQWPTQRRTRATETIVQGTTQAGAVVHLRWSGGNAEVLADDEGRFSASIPLGEGQNSLEVEAVDALGNRAHDVGDLQVRDTTGPAFHGGVEYGR
jgi:hypothetical protein